MIVFRNPGTNNRIKPVPFGRIQSFPLKPGDIVDDYVIHFYLKDNKKVEAHLTNSLESNCECLTCKVLHSASAREGGSIPERKIEGHSGEPGGKFEIIEQMYYINKPVEISIEDAIQAHDRIVGG